MHQVENFSVLPEAVKRLNYGRMAGSAIAGSEGAAFASFQAVLGRYEQWRRVPTFEGTP
jgi:hypothetical protein